jgi:hypothetical protein
MISGPSHAAARSASWPACLDGASGLGLLRSISRQTVRFLAEGPQGGGTMARQRRSGGLAEEESEPARREQRRVAFGGEGKGGVRLRGLLFVFFL